MAASNSATPRGTRLRPPRPRLAAARGGHAHPRERQAERQAERGLRELVRGSREGAAPQVHERLREPDVRLGERREGGVRAVEPPAAGAHRGRGGGGGGEGAGAGGRPVVGGEPERPAHLERGLVVRAQVDVGHDAALPHPEHLSRIPVSEPTRLWRISCGELGG